MGNNWKRQPKIQSQTTQTPTPSPSLTKDPISTVWDHEGTYQTPKQQYIPPKPIHFFPKLPRLWVMTGRVGLKSKVKTNHPPIPSPSLTKDRISTVWDHGRGGPYQTPANTNSCVHYTPIPKRYRCYTFAQLGVGLAAFSSIRAGFLHSLAKCHRQMEWPKYTVSYRVPNL